MFEGAEKETSVAHALFFGCDMGAQGTWLGELNAEYSAKEWIIEEILFSYKKEDAEKSSKRIRRLGLAIKNVKRNWIRIAPMKNSNIRAGLLSENISEVEWWVKDTLDQANV